MKRAYSLFLTLFVLAYYVLGKPAKTLNNPDYITISFSLSKQESVSFQYYDSLFNFHTLVFDNPSLKDIKITKKIYSKRPISWSYGILNDDLKSNWNLMYYVFLAQPGDSLSLSYSNKPYLNISASNPKNILAQQPLSFYSNVKPAPITTGNQSKNDSWHSFIKYFDNKYQEELNEIKAYSASNELTEIEIKNRMLVCKIRYYRKLFDWLWQGDGTYFEPTAIVLKERLGDIKNLLNDKDLLMTNELLNVIDGYIRLKLIIQNKDFSNGINVYSTAAEESLGTFKLSYLNVFLQKCPIKSGNAYSMIVRDYRNRYANTIYVHVLDSLSNISIKSFPLNNKLLSSNGTISDFKKIIAQDKQYIFIDFWASWCLPCRQQLPLLHKVKQRLRKYPVKFISINLDEKTEAWKVASNTEAQYLDENNFYLLPYLKKDLVDKLKMNQIPRYVVLKGSQILAADFYQPVEPSFEKELISLMSSNR